MYDNCTEECGAKQAQPKVTLEMGGDYQVKEPHVGVLLQLIKLFLVGAGVTNSELTVHVYLDFTYKYMDGIQQKTGFSLLQ